MKRTGDLVVASRFLRDQFRAFQVMDPNGRITDWVTVEYTPRPRMAVLENELRICLRFARTTKGDVQRVHVARALHWRKVIHECRRSVRRYETARALAKLMRLESAA